MRKLIYGINLTLDGCCDHTKGSGDQEMHEHYARLLREAEVLLYGRKTYELMVPFWPDLAKDNSTASEGLNDFARAFDSVGKIVVFSKSLEKADHEKTQIVRGNLRDEVLKLKQESGKSIMTGGVDLPAQLMELDLIDEYHFLVMPLIVGEGRRLFDTTRLQDKLQLQLAESKVFKSGNIALRYVNARRPESIGAER